MSHEEQLSLRERFSVPDVDCDADTTTQVP